MWRAMSAWLVTLSILVATCAVLALPFLAARSRRAILPVATLGSMAFVALLLIYANPFSGSFMASRSTVALDNDTNLSSQCANIVDLARQGRILLDNSNTSRPVVNRDIWPQLPQEIRQGIEVCFDVIRPANARQNPIEIVQR
jgi:hypothetical protein